MKNIILLILILLSDPVFSQVYTWRLLTASPGFSGVSRNEDISFINENTGWCVGYDGKVFRTTNGGLSWPAVFESTFGNQFRSVGFFDANTGLLGTLINDTNKILYRTTNGGFDWAAITDISGADPKGICGMSIVNQTTAYACGRYFGPARVIKTTDKGLSWSLVFSDTSKARTLIDCYFWSPDSGIAVGGNKENLTGNAVIIKTTNGGITWQQVHKTARTSEWCWKISFININTGFVSIERSSGFSYILKTTDNGNNWSEIPFMPYDQEGIGFLNENTGWVGGWSGPTYKTTNGGTNWSLAGWGTNMNRFRFLSDTVAYAVGDRIYKYSRGPVSISNNLSSVPEEYSLHQNYPNPFNPVTVINYTLKNSGLVTLKVFDVLGNEVTELVNEIREAGTYSVEFDGSSFSSGVYFYKIESGGFADSKRMILLK